MSEYYHKLASVQIIDEISNHNNANNLELANVLGWQVVIKKGEFKSGDKIIYLEIDSVCPATQWSLFLEKYKYRIKTIKIRGQLSQGLILPINLLGSENYLYIKGDDVTKKLGITKYENPEEKLDNAGLSNFPTHLGFFKTNEPRMQSCPELVKLFQGKEWYATIKYDGTSSTFYIDPINPKELVICSRNQKIVDYETNNIYFLIAQKYKIFDILSNYPQLVIQGEIYGPKIQGNKLGEKSLKLAIFSVYDMVKKKYYLMEEIIDICQKLGLEMAKIDSFGDYFQFTKNDLLDKAKGKYEGTKNDREGLVFRLQKFIYFDSERASFKVINNDFLEKEK